MSIAAKCICNWTSPYCTGKGQNCPYRDNTLHTPESKLEQAARAYATENMRHVDNDELDQFAIMLDAFIDGIKSEAAKEYWQSLTTPASNEVEGKFKGAWVSAKEGWPNEIGSVPIQYEDGRIDTYFIGIVDDRSKDTWFKCAEHWLYKWWDKNAPSKPHTVEEAAKEESEIEELREEAQDLLIKIAPPETFGEDADCERLYNIINELAKAASLPQSSTEEEKECKCGLNELPYDATITIKKCSRCGSNIN